jgi:sugar phosphate permease
MVALIPTRPTLLALGGLAGPIVTQLMVKDVAVQVQVIQTQPMVLVTVVVLVVRRTILKLVEQIEIRTIQLGMAALGVRILIPQMVQDMAALDVPMQMIVTKPIMAEVHNQAYFPKHLLIIL